MYGRTSNTDLYISYSYVYVITLSFLRPIIYVNKYSCLYIKSIYLYVHLIYIDVYEYDDVYHIHSISLDLLVLDDTDDDVYLNKLLHGVMIGFHIREV